MRFKFHSTLRKSQHIRGIVWYIIESNYNLFLDLDVKNEDLLFLGNRENEECDYL